MKILFVSDVYFPRVNGVSTSIATFRREMRLQGHSVHLIAPEYYAPSDDESHILRVPSRYLPMDPEDRLMKSSWVMANLGQLRAEFFDIVHVQTPFAAHYLGIKLARLMQIPCVETYHTFFEEYLYHYVPYLPKHLMKMVARGFSKHQGNTLDALVVPSYPMHEVLRSYNIKTPMKVIPTGIDPVSFRPGNGASFRKSYEIPEDRPLLLFVGRVAFEKNIDFLLTMLLEVRKQIPDVLLLIAGEGPARVGLEAKVLQLGLSSNVRFIGYLDRHTELRDCYSAADVFVFASRTETQGLVLLEAMAQSVPVVAIAEMGTRDVLEEGKGVLIAEDQCSDFSAKVIQLLLDRQARVQLGDAGFDYAKIWSSSQLSERMIDFYAETIQRYVENRTGY